MVLLLPPFLKEREIQTRKFFWIVNRMIVKIFLMKGEENLCSVCIISISQIIFGYPKIWNPIFAYTRNPISGYTWPITITHLLLSKLHLFLAFDPLCLKKFLKSSQCSKISCTFQHLQKQFSLFFPFFVICDNAT